MGSTTAPAPAVASWRCTRDPPRRACLSAAAIVGSQTAKTTRKGGARGYDAAKETLGRKRHVALDTLGLILVVIVHAAGVQDRHGVRRVPRELRWFPRVMVCRSRGACPARRGRAGVKHARGRPRGYAGHRAGT